MWRKRRQIEKRNDQIGSQGVFRDRLRGQHFIAACQVRAQRRKRSEIYMKTVHGSRHDADVVPEAALTRFVYIIA